MNQVAEEMEKALEELADRSIEYAKTVSDHPSQQASIAVEMTKSGARGLAGIGKMNLSDASDEFRISQLIQKKMGTDSSKESEEDKARKSPENQPQDEEEHKQITKEQWDKVNDMRVGDLPKWMRPGIIGNATEQKDDPKVTQLYDKFSAPPRTTPPPPLEENRGDVFLPPPPDIPVEFQVPPQPKDRIFVNPDPLMRSEDVAESGPTYGLKGPTSNVTRGEVEEINAKQKDTRPADPKKPEESKESQAGFGFEDTEKAGDIPAGQRPGSLTGRVLNK